MRVSVHRVIFGYIGPIFTFLLENAKTTLLGLGTFALLWFI